MAQFRNNKKFTRILYSKPSVIALALISLLFLFNIIDIAQKSKETKKNKDAALAKISELNSQQTELQYEIESLKTDSGIEKNIREKFPVIKDGEGLVVIVDSPSKDEAATGEKSHSGFWQVLKNLFKF